MSELSCPGVFFPEGHAAVPATGGPGKLLFLDRDGVINVNHGYVHTAEQTDWVPGVFELCAGARDAGYAIVVVTNQAGIARGYYTESQFIDYSRWVHRQFAERGVPLLATYYCPHHPQATLPEYRRECDCRKPQPGMILAALDDLGVQPSVCLLVGDMLSDRQAAEAAGIGKIWLIDELPSSPGEIFSSAAAG